MHVCKEGLNKEPGKNLTDYAILKIIISRSDTTCNTIDDPIGNE